MQFKPRRLTSRVIIPILVITLLSLGGLSFLVIAQVNRMTERLNTAFLAQKTSAIFSICERAVDQLVITRNIGKVDAVEAQKAYAVSEIELLLFGEELEGFVLQDGAIVASTFMLARPPELRDDRGTFSLDTKQGRYHGYYQYFPVWGWYLAAMMHEKPYWANRRTAYAFMAAMAAICAVLLVAVFVVLRFGLQRPLAAIMKDLEVEGSVRRRTNTLEIDTLADVINDALRRAEDAQQQVLQVENEKLSLATEARTDSMTGLPNRRRFNEALHEEIHRAKRYNMSLSLILFDVDHFKAVNDTFGHRTGDRVLKELAQLVSESVRRQDILARWGGEEFAILIPHGDLESARQLALKVWLVIAMYEFEEVEHLTCSFGVSQYRLSESAEQLIMRTDEALYRAKSSGRNRVEWA